MKKRKKYVTALVVFSATLGTSHLMQSTWSVSADDTPKAPPIAEATPMAASVVPALPEVTSGVEKPAMDLIATMPDPVGATLVPVKLETESTAADPADALVLPDMPQDVATPPLPTPGPSPLDRLALTGSEAIPEAAAPEVSEYGLACDVILSAAERPLAMVNLAVTAPCRGGERITIRHGGLVFSATLNALGSYMEKIPALTDDARFNISFQDGSSADTGVIVTEADRSERVVLQYNGRTGLQIHALEFGADYGEAGHVWAGNARDAETAINMGGGYLTALGDPTLEDAFLAEVYTLPTDITGRDGVVRLTVEAEVNADNCDKTIAGQTFQRQPDGGMTPVALTLSMPDCDAVGEFLVLKNLLRDLKIASN